METLRRTKNREFNRIIKNMKPAEQPAEVQATLGLKRHRDKEPDEVPSKKQKFSEWEIDNEEFEKQLNGENKFLEGFEEV